MIQSLAVLFSFLLSFGTSSLAFGGECEGKNPGNSVFCEGKDKASCKFHNLSCEWKEGQIIKVVVERSESDKECTTQDGKEAHESFCAGLSKQVCKTHSGVCQWK